MGEASDVAAWRGALLQQQKQAALFQQQALLDGFVWKQLDWVTLPQGPEL